MRKTWFLPALLAVVTGLGTGAFVHQHQSDYPVQLATLQLMMIGAAVLVAVPEHWVRLMSIPFLFVGVLVAGMSIGLFYLPVVIAAGIVVCRRPSERQPNPNFLDSKLQNGISYTESEIAAITYRQNG